MSFRPRMTAQTRAYRTLRPLSVRSWAGVVADVWHVHGDAGGGGSYLSPDPRLVVFLGTPPAGMGVRTRADGATQRGPVGFFVPAGAPLWSDMSASADFAHLDLHLDSGPLLQRLGRDASALPTEAVMLHDGARVQPLAAMIAAEVESPSRPVLMVDGLLSALLSEALRLPVAPDEGRADLRGDLRGGLTPRQMAAVARFVDDNIAGRVSVAALAEVAGLSESWFSRAFRKTTGDQPQKWLMARRVEAARRLILDDPAAGLAEVAQAAGFADQAHLSRAFRAAHGLPPAQWRRLQVPDAAAECAGLPADCSMARQIAAVPFKSGSNS